MITTTPTVRETATILAMVKEGKRLREICEAFPHIPGHVVLDTAYPRKGPHVDPSVRLLRAIFRDQ